LLVGGIELINKTSNKITGIARMWPD